MSDPSEPERVLLRESVQLDDVRALADGHGWSLVFEMPRGYDVMAARRWETADGTSATYVEDHVSGIRYIVIEGPDRAGIAEFIRGSLPHHTQEQLLTAGANTDAPVQCIRLLCKLAALRPAQADARYVELWARLLGHPHDAVRRAAIRTAYELRWSEMLELAHEQKERLEPESRLRPQLERLIAHLGA